MRETQQFNLIRGQAAGSEAPHIELLVTYQYHNLPHPIPPWHFLFLHAPPHSAPALRLFTLFFAAYGSFYSLEARDHLVVAFSLCRI